MSTPDQLSDIHCRVEEVIEAIGEGRRPELSLGIVACIACNGIFDVRMDVGEKPQIVNKVYVPCIKGYSNDLEASTDK